MTEQDLTSLKKKFGKHLKKIRKEKGMSLLDVQYNCSLDNSNISKIEQGQFNVTLGTIVELAKGLEIEPARLMEF